MKHDWGTWVTVLALAGSIAVSWGTLSQKAETAVENHVRQELSIKSQDERIRALENSRALETQLNALTNQVVALSVKVDALSDQLRRKR